MQFRKATEVDVSLLARLNLQLIQDEGHRNRMALPELQARMRCWLQHEYEAVIFEQHAMPVAYALYRKDDRAIYLRQFFVDRQHRRRGIGRRALQILLAEVWPPSWRITLEVLAQNRTGYAFWKALGFQDYAVTLEMMRGDQPV
jgi:GNAT superfamily N-acetyltransferase